MIAFILSNLKNIFAYLIGGVAIWCLATLNGKKHEQLQQKDRELKNVKDAIEIRKKIDNLSDDELAKLLHNARSDGR